MKMRGAIAAIKQPRNISEKFKLQEFWLDTSNYNQMTGEKYENHNLLQVVNDKVDLSEFKRGDLLDVDFYLNGRFYDKQDGSRGFMQSLTAYKIEQVRNTAGQPVVISEEQLNTPELPE